MEDLWAIERACFERGFSLVCGCDEAGAGPLAGAVYAAAVILPAGLVIEGLRDSKQVTPGRREKLFEIIARDAVAWAVDRAEVEEIDEMNILNARLLAMDRAIRALSPAPEYALIDGNRNKGISIPNEMAVRGDARSASIAAASILAKVSRDRYMEEMAVRYPQYGFERHKGYPTKAHYEMLRRYGPCPIHRRTFLKKL